MSTSATFGLVTADEIADDIAETDILAELADWIEKYLQATEHLAEQWWDLFLDERDFWETFPLLAEALVRRGYARPSILLLNILTRG